MARKYREGNPSTGYGAIVTDGHNPCRTPECVESCDRAYGGKMIAESVTAPDRRRIVAALNFVECMTTEDLEAALDVGACPMHTDRATACAVRS